MLLKMTQTIDNDPRLDRIEQKLDNLVTELDNLVNENEKFNNKFDNYQKATQWVVQLAFTLIASATITVIISTVLRK
jgi:ribosomal protein L16 Arg81 hydroxylase